MNYESIQNQNFGRRMDTGNGSPSNSSNNSSESDLFELGSSDLFTTPSSTSDESDGKNFKVIKHNVESNEFRVFRDYYKFNLNILHFKIFIFFSLIHHRQIFSQQHGDNHNYIQPLILQWTARISKRIPWIQVLIMKRRWYSPDGINEYSIILIVKVVW